MYASEIQNQEQLQMQSEVFDQMMDERSENIQESIRCGTSTWLNARWMIRSQRSSSSRSLNNGRPVTTFAQRTHACGARRACRAPPERRRELRPDSDLSAEQQAQVAAQRQAFDYEAAERAEILREHEVLETLLMAHLKNEDEITKKWIALV